MKRILLFALLVLMVGANVLFAAVNYKETPLLAKPGIKTGDSTRAQLVVGANWMDIMKFRTQTGGYPAMIRVISYLKAGDTDCDSVTYLWLSTADTSATLGYTTRDSTEISGNTAGARVLFTANIEDSVYQYNIIAARPQCDDAAAALLRFNTFIYLYDGLGSLYMVVPYTATFKQAAGGGI